MNPEPVIDGAEWEKWRDFIGSKRVCQECGLVIGDPELHARWHETQRPTGQPGS